jgi:hypothetical protein
LDDDDVPWEGVTYHFEKGKTVVLKSVWQAFTDLTMGIHEMLEKVRYNTQKE